MPTVTGRGDDAVQRRSYLAGSAGTDEFFALRAAWTDVLRALDATGPGHATITVPLSLLQAPTWTGTTVSRPRSPGGAAGRPRGVPFDPSVLARLASGGADALPLRLYLTILAVHQVAGEQNLDQVAAVPVMPDRRSRHHASTVTWADLVMVGVPRRQLDRASTMSPSRLRSLRRQRLTKAIALLADAGLITVVKTDDGRLHSLHLTDLPAGLPYEVTAGARDAVLPRTYFTTGWNGVLWGDEIMLLLTYLAAPLSPLFAHVDVGPNGVQVVHGHSTHRGEGMSVIGQTTFLTESRRLQQFNIHDSRYRQMHRLVQYGLAQPTTAPAPPEPVQRAINISRDKRASDATAQAIRDLDVNNPDATEGFENLDPMVFDSIPWDRPLVPASAASYSIHTDTLHENARMRLMDALLRAD